MGEGKGRFWKSGPLPDEDRRPGILSNVEGDKGDGTSVQNSVGY